MSYGPTFQNITSNREELQGSSKASNVSRRDLKTGLTFNSLWFKVLLVLFIATLAGLLIQSITKHQQQLFFKDIAGELERQTLSSPNKIAKSEIEELAEWAQNLQFLIEEDNHREQILRRPLTLESDTQVVRETFYELMNFPLRSVCLFGKFFGGQWISRYGCIDGHKFVCLDNFYPDVKLGQCLVYSFGISNDWTFESALASMGCRVVAHDPTIDGSAKPDNDLIQFRRLGIQEKSSNSTPIGPVMTLKDAVTSNGDLGMTITYLKVDVEGGELKSLREWIESGILSNVRQIGIEFHTGKRFVQAGNAVPVLLRLIEDCRSLYNLGFRLISSDLNGCVGRGSDYQNRYNPFFEIVFYKP